MLVAVFNLLIVLTVAIAISWQVSIFFNYLFSGRLSESVNFIRVVEEGIVRVCEFDISSQDWKPYIKDLLILNITAFVILFATLICQYFLPLNPAKFIGIRWDLAFNISTSFILGTDWQAYSGEQILSYFSQVIITFIAFISSASCICLGLCFIRGIANDPGLKSEKIFGNFWVDFIRASLFFLLPACLLIGVIFISQGVIQNYVPYLEFVGFNGERQVIAQGPVAAFEAIKIFGVNGGGYFGANSSYPYENPSAITDFLQSVLMLIIPIALIFYYGKAINKQNHAILLVALISILALIGVIMLSHFEASLMNGKEQRFGVSNSSVFSVLSVMSSGASNSAYSYFSIKSQILLFIYMATGGAILGGVGVGIMNLMVYIILSVFICGMMVGRTPQFIGKKISAHEIKMIIIYLLVYQSIIILGTASVFYFGYDVDKLDSHGFKAITQVFYTLTSVTVSNGSSFGPFPTYSYLFNIMTAVFMLLGRIIIIYTMMSLSASLAKKKPIFSRLGDVPVDKPFFLILMLFVMLNDILVFIPLIIIGLAIN